MLVRGRACVHVSMCLFELTYLHTNGADLEQVVDVGIHQCRKVHLFFCCCRWVKATIPQIQVMVPAHVALAVRLLHVTG